MSDPTEPPPLSPLVKSLAEFVFQPEELQAAIDRQISSVKQLTVEELHKLKLIRAGRDRLRDMPLGWFRNRDKNGKEFGPMVTTLERIREVVNASLSNGGEPNE